MRRLNMFCFILLVFGAFTWGYCKIDQFRERDGLAPVITVEKMQQKVSVSDGNQELLKGITATDATDGDVTDSVVVESISDFMNDGRRIVTFAAFDSSNNVSKATKQISYTDYRQPHFSFSGPMNFTTGDNDYLNGVKVDDVLDGDLSDSVRFSQGSTIYSNVPGDYDMKLEVTNSAGDTVYLPFTLTIYDASTYSRMPHIALTDYVVYVGVGENLDMTQYLSSVTLNGIAYGIGTGGESARDTINVNAITLSDVNVDYNTPGVYEAEYTMYSADGLIGRTRLIVVVEE